MADPPSIPLRLSSAKNLLNLINKNFGTIPFCRRYIDRLGQDKYLLGVSIVKIYLYIMNEDRMKLLT